MKRASLILISVCVIVMLPVAFGQGTPSQSQEPSTQTPNAQQPSQSPRSGLADAVWAGRTSERDSLLPDVNYASIHERVGASPYFDGWRS